MVCVEPIRDIKTLKHFEKCLLNKSDRDYILFIIGINSGFRISDILRLKIADVKNKDFIEIIEQKTGKYRRFPLNSQMKSILKKYCEYKKLDSWLFPSRKAYGHISRVQAYRIINGISKELNLDLNIGTHTLRKTFGYHFYKQTKDIALLQTILNHSSPNITLRYIGINQEIVENSLKKFFLL